MVRKQKFLLYITTKKQSLSQITVQDDPSIDGNQQQEYIEYIGACLLEPINANIQYTLSLDLGAPIESNDSPAILVEELVILGIPNCNFPILGNDCKEDNFEVIAENQLQYQLAPG